MLTKLYKIETCGIKNIKETISISFMPDTIKKGRKTLSRVKGIYGTNGVGKTAFMTSVLIYQKLLTDKNYLNQDKTIEVLNKLINKETKEFRFTAVFEASEKVFKHEIVLNFNNDRLEITSESLSVLTSNTINGTYDKIVSSDGADLTFYKNSDDPELDGFFASKCKNVLKYSSFAAIILDSEILDRFSKTLNKLIKNKNVFKAAGAFSVLLLKSLGDEIVVFLDSEDVHREDNDIKLANDLNAILKKINKPIYKAEKDTDIVLKNDKKTYELYLSRMTKFIKIFKPELLKIDYECSEDFLSYRCKKKMVYKDYQIDFEYESTGIKKLMRIFNSLEKAKNGYAVFIDELDANINGVYLNSLLKYINENGAGQLCFTLHNLYPMEYLCKLSNAIDFIGETGKAISWAKDGHYRPYKLYPEGMIMDSPFNVDSTDFLYAFESEDSECN